MANIEITVELQATAESDRDLVISAIRAALISNKMHPSQAQDFAPQLLAAIEAAAKARGDIIAQRAHALANRPKPSLGDLAKTPENQAALAEHIAKREAQLVSDRHIRAEAYRAEVAKADGEEFASVMRGVPISHDPAESQPVPGLIAVGAPRAVIIGQDANLISDNLYAEKEAAHRDQFSTEGLRITGITHGNLVYPEGGFPPPIGDGVALLSATHPGDPFGTEEDEDPSVNG